MSSLSKSDSGDTQLAEPPQQESAPVEPPPSKPGKGDTLPPNHHPSSGGFYELTAAGVVRGWALDPDAPSQYIEVYFYVDGLMSTRTFVGSARAMLAGMGGTEGANHGFSWRIPDKYRDGTPHTLYAYAIDFSRLQDYSPLIVEQRFVLQPGNDQPLGSLESVSSDGTVRGWAVDPNSDSQELTVFFYVSYSHEDDTPKSRTFAGQVVANLQRPDVNWLTGCSGNHGFEWSLPLQFRSAVKLYAQVADTSTQARTLLPGSPKYITSGSEL